MSIETPIGASRPIAENSSKKRNRFANAIYVALTPPGILRTALRNRSFASDGQTISRAVELAERNHLRSHVGLAISEPGPFVEENTEWVAASISRRLENVNPNNKMFIDQTIQRMEELGRVPRKRIRSTRKMLRRIPNEHVRVGVDAVTIAPLKGINKLLHEQSEIIDPEIDNEATDTIRSIGRRFNDQWKATGGMFDSQTKSIAYTDAKVDTFISWFTIHEAGHGVFNFVLTDVQREEWKQLSKGYITRYAQHTTQEHRHRENFSEMYALYSLGRPLLKIWSLFDKDIAAQYKFFKSFMPKGTPILPTSTAVIFLTQDKIITGLAAHLTEKHMGIPADEMLDNYNSDKDDQKLSPKSLRSSSEKLLKFFFGHAKPGELDLIVANSLTEEYIDKNWDLIHNSFRMREFLIRNGILHESDKDKADFGLCGLDENDNNALYSAYPVFLKNRILFITPDGKKRVPYTSTVKEQIRDALGHDTIYKADSPLSQVQHDAITALVEPTEADLEAKRTFEEKYGIPLQDSSTRAFSAHVIESLDEILGQLPPTDRETIGGIYRIRDRRGKNKKLQKLKKKGYIPVDDMTLAGTSSNLERHIIENVGASAIANDPTLFANFLEISAWGKLHAGPLKKVLFAMRQRNIKNPVSEYRQTDQDARSFLLPFEPSNVGQDFVSCYASYLLNTEQFAHQAQDDPVLQAKYDLMAEHFSSGPQHATIGLS